MRTAFITGVAGFCGRHLVKRLRAEEDIAILGYDRLEEPPDGLILDEYIRGDILDCQQLSKLLRRVSPQWIFHLAGIYHGPAVDIYQTNVMGTIHLLEAVRTQKLTARV